MSTGALPAAELDLASVPRPLDGAVAAILDGEAVVLEPGGAAHVLNASAARVWEALDGVRTVREVSRSIAVHHGESAELAQDVLDFVRLLGAQGLLEGVARMVPLTPARPEGLDIGTPLPLFDRVPSAGASTLLVSWSPWCGYCRQLAPVLAEQVPRLSRNGVAVVLVEATESAETPALLASAGLDVALQVDGDLARAVFADLGTPAGYLVDGEGRTLADVAIGSTEVEALAAALAGDPGGTPEH